MEITIKGDVEEIKDLLQVMCGNEEQIKELTNRVDVLKGEVTALEYYERQRRTYIKLRSDRHDARYLYSKRACF